MSVIAAPALSLVRRGPLASVSSRCRPKSRPQPERSAAEVWDLTGLDSMNMIAMLYENRRGR
jgi:hypothetical protein